MNEKAKSCGGFTLIELILVVVLISITAAMAAPNIADKMADLNLGGEARNVMALLQQARLKAVKENNFVVVAFDPDDNGTLEGNFMAFVDDGGTRYQYDAGEKVLFTGSLAKGIEVKAAFTASDPGVTYVCFNRKGYPIDAATPFNGAVTLKNSKGYTKKVSLGLGGTVKITRD